MFSRFLADKRGVVAPIFAIAAIPLFAATGAAVDYSRAYQLRGSVQAALDSAALAANKLIGLKPLSEIEKEAKAFFDANTEQVLSESISFTTTLDSSGVELKTRLEVPTRFLGMLGISQIVFDLTSKSVAGAATYEIALVLDNSGSMKGSKISSLKTAAKDLVRILFDVNASNPKDDPVKFALVPFAASVNVGPQYKTASWMDQDGLSPIHHQDFETAAKRPTRWQLYDYMKNTSWAGCVETRPHPYDISDDAPTKSNPATLFVPMFAPDEPDIKHTSGSSNGKDKFPNNYLPDHGDGTKSGACAKAFDPTPDNASTNKQKEVQARLCKYGTSKNSVTPDIRAAGSDLGQTGPNFACTTTPIQSLTTSKTTIDTQINAMQANGYTNIHAGVMWGWRALSPGEPFTEGRAYDAKDNRKILVVMTDGANTYSTTGSNSVYNKSNYGYFGYVEPHKHLGTGGTVVSRMNNRTLQACEAAKATGKITVYTVAFQVSDTATLQMLNDCASSPDMAFISSNNADLIATFNQIATDISLLRLAK